MWWHTNYTLHTHWSFPPILPLCHYIDIFSTFPHYSTSCFLILFHRSPQGTVSLTIWSGETISLFWVMQHWNYHHNSIFCSSLDIMLFRRLLLSKISILNSLLATLRRVYPQFTKRLNHAQIHDAAVCTTHIIFWLPCLFHIPSLYLSIKCILPWSMSL